MLQHRTYMVYNWLDHWLNQIFSLDIKWVFNQKLIKNWYIQKFNFDLTFQSYPDEGHHLYGVLEHAYRTMEYNLRDCLTLDTDDDRIKGPGSE